jgi:hypothetical protein
MSARLEPIVSRVFATGESEHGIELHGSPVGEDRHWLDVACRRLSRA